MHSEWRCRVSIPVPVACKATALPIELHPLNDSCYVYVECVARCKTIYACMHAEGGQVGIEPTTSRTQIENHTTRPLTHSLYVMITLLRAPRIELGTYCVLSSRHNQLDQARI